MELLLLIIDLQNNNYVHNDLHYSNLLERNNHFVIIDLGWAVNLEEAILDLDDEDDFCLDFNLFFRMDLDKIADLIKDVFNKYLKNYKWKKVSWLKIDEKLNDYEDFVEIKIQ